jgi:hypothetical protein
MNKFKNTSKEISPLYLLSLLYRTTLDRLTALMQLSRRELNGHGFSVQLLIYNIR